MTASTERRRARVRAASPSMRTPRFGAFLHTVDDMDLLPHAIEHLRRIGVDEIVLIDYGSTDGTLEYLRTREEEPGLWVLHADPTDPDPWWDEIRLVIGRSLGVDWILFVDADELWLPAGGSLRDIGGLDGSDALNVFRYNVVVGPDGPLIPFDRASTALDEVLLYARPRPDQYREAEANPDASWIDGALEPKVMARPDAVASMLAGDHGVDVGPRRRPPRYATDVLIAHVHFRDREAFRRGIVNYRRAIDAQPWAYTGYESWQWVRWVRMADEGRTDEEFDRQTLSGPEIEAARASGLIRSAADILARPLGDITSEATYAGAAGRSQPWLALAAAAFERHGLPAGPEMRVASSSTLPVVLSGTGHVVKLFGPWEAGGTAVTAEAQAMGFFARDPATPCPRLVARGTLDEGWGYIIQTEMPGAAVADVRGSIAADAWSAAAASMGRALRRLHRVEPTPEEVADAGDRFEDFLRHRLAVAPGELASGAVLPQPLLDELPEWLPDLDELMSLGRAVVPLHTDLHDEHVLGRVIDGRFYVTGIIDFDGFRLGHPMYELGPIWGFLLQGRADLLRTFLAEAGLPGLDQVGFARIALAWCLLHAGIAQGPVDVPAVSTAASLDELARATFGEPERDAVPT
jgi:hygromycin-B 7''-O-kinase